jgi:DNA-binding NtrC family response regulator
MKILYVGLETDPFVKTLRQAFHFPNRVRTTTPEYFDEIVWHDKFDVIVLDEVYNRYLLDKIKFSQKSFINNHSRIVVYGKDNNNWRRYVELIKAGATDYLTKIYDPRVVKEQIEHAQRVLIPA